MYMLEDAQELMPCFRTVDYGEPVEPCNGIRVEFFDAGHLLGSASIKLTITENDVPHRLVFSGDVGTPTEKRLLIVARTVNSLFVGKPGSDTFALFFEISVF